MKFTDGTSVRVVVQSLDPKGFLVWRVGILERRDLTFFWMQILSP